MIKGNRTTVHAGHRDSPGTVDSGPLHAADAKPAKPNIILILADYLGIDGVSWYRADKRKTPEIDKLAASGTRFETCYASPLCGPSRCLLMTGRYAFRTGGITIQSSREGGPGAKSGDGQPMAKLLKQAGYATAQSDKWRQVGETPREWGFDDPNRPHLAELAGLCGSMPFDSVRSAAV